MLIIWNEQKFLNIIFRSQFSPPSPGCPPSPPPAPGSAPRPASLPKGAGKSGGGKRTRWLLCYHMGGGAPSASPSPPSEHAPHSQCSTPSPTDHGFKLPNSFSNERPTSLPVALLNCSAPPDRQGEGKGLAPLPSASLLLPLFCSACLFCSYFATLFWANSFSVVATVIFLKCFCSAPIS